jgi:hypothetical protein
VNRSLTASLRRTRIALAAIACAASITSVAQAGTVHFESPSGNINCYVFSTPKSSADCIVRTATWPHPPRKPSSCDLDWMPYEVAVYGRTVTLGGCRGDVGPRCYAGSGRCEVLAYGSSVTLGTVRCSSATTGVTCRSTVGTRAGFRVARESVVVYR